MEGQDGIRAFCGHGLRFVGFFSQLEELVQSIERGRSRGRISHCVLTVKMVQRLTQKNAMMVQDVTTRQGLQQAHQIQMQAVLMFLLMMMLSILPELQ